LFLYCPEAEIKPHIRDYLYVYYITATFHGISGTPRPLKPTNYLRMIMFKFFSPPFPSYAHKTSR